MKQNILQNVIGFVLKYIWMFCILLMVLEVVSVTYTATILMQQSSQGVMQAVSGEISGRVDGVLRLLDGFANDIRFSDTSQTMYDRIIQARPYQESYGLYMIAVTDEKYDVVSADEMSPPTEFYNLRYREYMQKLYATGEYQITDAFLAGADNKTVNYTIAVPIMKEDKVVGGLFGSIYFNDIMDILDRNMDGTSRNFFMLGEKNTVMAGGNGIHNDEAFLDLSKDTFFFDCSSQKINKNMLSGTAGSCWEWGADGLTYMIYQRVAPTNWTLVYRVEFVSVLGTLLPVMLSKIFFYILMCAAVHLLGKRYLNRHLAQVNHLLNRMAVIQKELFQSEQMDYDNLLELTQTGLTDQLTGLATRAVLFRKIVDFTDAPHSFGAVVFIDLDDLKRLNDNFGHEGGDCALLHFAQTLKKYEQEHGGTAARYGGDEFIFILNAIDEAAATVIVNKLCEDLTTSITTKGNTFTIHGSIGVSFYPEHGTKPEELICKADLALYTAKQQGKNQCSFYSESNTIVL